MAAEVEEAQGNRGGRDAKEGEALFGREEPGKPGQEPAVEHRGEGACEGLQHRPVARAPIGHQIGAIATSAGALLKVLDKPHLDLTTPIGRGFIAFLSAMAEDERQRIVKRANDGRKVARSKGVRFGRKPKLTDHQQAEALKRIDAVESCRSIARGMAVHHATISRLAGA